MNGVRDKSRSSRSAEDPQLYCTKTMYGGKNIAKGDAVFIFASENEGGRGLLALQSGQEL